MIPFQAYLVSIEDKTGLTPRQIIEDARTRGFLAPDAKSSDIRTWLKTSFGLGHGHALLMTHVIENESQRARTGQPGREDLDVLWLDGKQSAPRP